MHHRNAVEYLRKLIAKNEGIMDFSEPSVFWCHVSLAGKCWPSS